MAGAVYWIGADGNAYLKSANGVQKFTNPSGFSNAGFQGLLNGVQGQSVQATRIADPNPPKSSGTTTSSAASGPSYTNGVNDPTTLAGYDIGIQNLQNSINNLGGQRDSGYRQADAQWQDAINTLLNSRNQAENTYNNDKKTAQTDFIQGKNSVGMNAGNLLRGIQRLLGSRGAGGSSDARVAAPDAIGRLASQQFSEQGNIFKKNNSELDTGWGNYGLQYEGQRKSADAQRTNNRTNVDNAVNERLADFQGKLALLQGQRAAATGGNGGVAAAHALAAANAAAGRAANYTIAPTVVNTPAYATPSLDTYKVDPITATAHGQAPGNDYSSPYLAALLGNAKKKTVAA